MTEEPFFAQMSLLLKSASIPCAIMTLRLNSIDASRHCLELKLKKGDKKVHPILMSWATWHCPLYYVFVGVVPQPCGHLRSSTCGCWWASCWLNWSVYIIPHRLIPFTFLKFQTKDKGLWDPILDISHWRHFLSVLLDMMHLGRLLAIFSFLKMYITVLQLR